MQLVYIKPLHQLAILVAVAVICVIAYVTWQPEDAEIGTAMVCERINDQTVCYEL